MSGEFLGDFSDILGGVGRVYPEDVSQPRTPAQHAFDKDRAMRRKIDKLFSTKNGAEVLAWLKAHTIDRPVLPFDTLGVMSRDDRASLADFREGENEVVRLIILSIRDNRRGERDEE